MFEILTIPLLQDNYSYLLIDRKSSYAAVVDPADAGPILKILVENDLELNFILCTHHHADHTGGNLELKKYFNAKVVGASFDSHRIPGIDIEVNDSKPFLLGTTSVKIIKIPGHTLGHIAFYFSKEEALFCGDTFFSIGCGRLFEGTAEQMWESLNLLSAFPSSTQVYCGHEYTESNIRFAKTIDPENKNLLDYEIKVKSLRDRGVPSIPSLLSTELAANPFLRCRDANEFARVRELKNRF